MNTMLSFGIPAADRRVVGFFAQFSSRPWWSTLSAIIVTLILAWARGNQYKKRINPFKDLAPNRDAITCPRCHAPYPGGYEPRSHRELMWKGVVCPQCGCEYDDRGRERKDVPHTLTK
jgi:hypothetical protein